MGPPRICVVIPCYRVRDQVLSVIAAIPNSVDRIYAVDDACPDSSGSYIEEHCLDRRVVVIKNQFNEGVGGAVIKGYRQAIADDMDIAVKIDGDGQMDPVFLPRLVKPIASGHADYSKGNRFFSIDMVRTMPPVRLFGNAVLSFVNKMVSGYWSVMDPTNGFTALHTALLRQIPLDRLDKGYFFESDLLFHLGVLRAVVIDVPMRARYGDEVSNLRIRSVLLRFPGKYAIRFLKRFFYNYLMRDFNAGSLQTILGLLSVLLGTAFGITHWVRGAYVGATASAGTVMLAALPIIIGVQLMLSALQYDMENQPRRPVHRLLDDF